MHQRFLAGLDKNFIDYDKIDNNVAYDDTKIIDQDIEDEFFDEIQDFVDKNNSNGQSEYTGIHGKCTGIRGNILEYRGIQGNMGEYTGIKGNIGECTK